MARRKKAEDETPEQMAERHLFEQISNHANRSEKTAWKRKQSNMGKLIIELEPVEAEILNILLTKKQPLLDDIMTIRDIMVHDCIHPFEFLVQKEGYVECKFCNRKIRASNGEGI